MPALVRDTVRATAAGMVARRENALALPVGTHSDDFSLPSVLLAYGDAAGGVLAGGDSAGLFVGAVDVTQRRVAEESLRLARPMGAVGRPPSAVAHVLNNMVMIIGAGLEALARRPPREPRTEWVLEAARLGGQRG